MPRGHIRHNIELTDQQFFKIITELKSDLKEGSFLFSIDYSLNETFTLEGIISSVNTGKRKS